MRVEVDNARVVGPSNSFGEQFITTKPTQATTYRGGTEILAENAIPSGRLEVAPADGSRTAVSLSDVFGGATIGPINYQVVHVNAEYADQTSDHDPQVVDLTP